MNDSPKNYMEYLPHPDEPHLHKNGLVSFVELLDRSLQHLYLWLSFVSKFLPKLIHHQSNKHVAS